ncbi:uncharacterized protein LOC107039399 [Diachasma alloeum]|uniref:uncharacterized protein LOC107039399 n=1 Tax=Diachasma alloeum TaxID=454923 RepID=UPI0007381FD7|nr:uncharacterized protein LOC107039399 [Diachasma alloeum]
MLRRLFVIVLIIIGLNFVVNTAEPTFRRYPRSLIDDNTVTIDCAGSHAESPECRSVLEKNDTSLIGGHTGAIQEEEKSWNFADLFDDSIGDEARGKKGKKKGMGKYFIIMAGAAKATLMYVMLHAVALLAGKALIVAKVALALAAAVALKKALEHNDKTSVEIIKHPQHSYHQTHSSSVDYDHGDGFEGHRRRRFAR